MFCSQAIIRDEFEKTKVTLTESSRRKLEAAVASARAESDDAAKAAAHGLRREADGARREASRAAVAARQLERSLEKTKERMDEEHAKAVGVLEAKIGSLDRTVKELRRERNALLADARAHRARQRLEQRTNETSMGQSPSVVDAKLRPFIPGEARVLRVTRRERGAARPRYRVRANSQEEPE